MQHPPAKPGATAPGLPAIHIARAYDEVDPALGRRVLVDRLWPRGLARASAPFDEWLRDVAPSAELRRWYGHRPERFEAFADRYRSELAQGPPAEGLGRLEMIARTEGLVVVTATRDVERSGAAVLFSLLTSPGGDRDHLSRAHTGGTGQRGQMARGGAGGAEEGGDAPCYAHLLCPDCGVVVEEGIAHRSGCGEPTVGE